MSIHQIHFFSNTLRRNTTATVILPEPKINNQVSLKFSRDFFDTLWLLHGLGDDDSSFLRFTNIEQYANEHNLAVVMPNFDRSFYTNMTNGYNYWDYLTTELPSRMRSFYPLSNQPSRNIVGGNSMGGYGALKWTLNMPNTFCNAIILSGVVDLQRFSKEQRDLMPDFDLVFKGKSLSKSSLDLSWLISKNEKVYQQLNIYHSIGTKDFLWDSSQKLRRQLERTLGDNYHFTAFEGGHEWHFWDLQLEKALNQIFN